MPLSSRRMKQLSAFYNRLHTVDVFYQAQAQFGGGLFFEPETNQLLWTDQQSNNINFLNVDSGENRSITLPDKVGAVIPLEWSTNLVAATGRKLCIVDRETGAVLQEPACVEDDKPGNSFSNVKCDANGRLWASTTGPESQQGSLYNCYLGGTTHCDFNVSKLTGLGWNPDYTTMYCVDSITRCIYKYDYNIANGTISNQEHFINDYVVFPNGLCTDAEGRLWVTSTNGVCCYDPTYGERLVHMATPKSGHVTSCCFGGPNHSWLFVICARNSVSDYVDYRNAGAIFVFKEIGTKGLPANRFKYLI